MYDGRVLSRQSGRNGKDWNVEPINLATERILVKIRKLFRDKDLRVEHAYPARQVRCPVKGHRKLDCLGFLVVAGVFDSAVVIPDLDFVGLAGLGHAYHFFPSRCHPHVVLERGGNLGLGRVDRPDLDK